MSCTEKKTFGINIPQTIICDLPILKYDTALASVYLLEVHFEKMS